MKSLFWRRLYIDFHYLPLKKHGTTCSGNALLMVEVKAYEKWVTKVMSCVSVGLFPNSVIATIFEVVLSDLKLSIDGYCWLEWWYGCNNRLTEEDDTVTQWVHWRWKIMQVSNLEGIDFWGEMIWGEGGWLVLMWCLALQCTRKQNAHHPLTSFRLWFLASHHTTHVTI